jgi:signal transduction histidine kinase
MIRRIFLSIIISAAVLGGILSVSAFVVTKATFTEIDSENIEKVLGLSKSFLNREKDSLLFSASDWANWDDTNNFVLSGGKDIQYVNSNLDQPTLTQLRVSNMFLFDKSGNLLFGCSSNSESFSILNHDEVFSFISVEISTALKKAAKGDRCSGFSFIGDVPLVVSVCPVTSSKERDVVNGVLVFFRRISPVLEDIGNSVSSFAVDRQKKNIQVASSVSLDEKIISGTFSIPCVCGECWYSVSVSSESVYESKGKELVFWFVFIVFFCVSVLCFSLWRVLRVFVLDRLSAAMRSVKEIACSASLSKRFPGANRKDEFGVFIGCLNGMLDALNKEVVKNQEREEAVRRSERVSLLGKFASGIAHDMNNQLAVIKGYADSLRFAKSLPEAMNLCEKISRVVNGCVELISKILSFSKKGNINHSKIDINEMLVDVIVLFRYVLEVKNIQIDQKIDALSSSIMGDRSELQNAILNVLVNAREAVGEKGKISISTKNVVDPEGLETGEYVSVVVSDSGPGFSKAAMENLFVPFQTTKSEGVGLGLSIVHGAISRHKGSISVESVPGKTSIEMLFPCVVSDKKKESQRLPIVKKERPRILHVEDDRGIREIVKLQFESNGFTIDSFADGDSGIKFFSEHQNEIDVVILDFVVPPVDGLYIMEGIRKVNPEVPIAFMTGFYETNTEDLKSLGAFAVFEKPIDFPSVLRVVNDVLSKRV